MNKSITQSIESLTDIDTERAVVACCLVDNASLELSDLASDDFSDLGLRKLFDFLRLMQAAREPMNQLHIINGLKSAGLLDAIGGPVELAKIISRSDIESKHVRFYADRLRSLSAKRRLAVECAESLKQALERGTDPYLIGAELQARLDSVLKRRQISIRTAEEVACESIAEKQKSKRCQIYTGFPDYDEIFGGLFGGELIILAARTSMGKSALALQIAEYNAQRSRAALFVSLEMKDQELIDRIISRESCIPLSRMRGELNALEIECLKSAAEKSFNELPLLVFAPAWAKVSDIRAAAKLAKARNNISLLVVDYLQQIIPSDRRQDRWEQVGQMVSDLKILARELDVPVIALAQLRRDAERKKPTLSMLRESGNIEQAADFVWFIDGKHGTTSGDVSKAELIIAKNRQGPRNKLIELDFIGKETRFAPRSNYTASEGEVGKENEEDQPVLFK